jgi:hypothetical protein
LSRSTADPLLISATVDYTTIARNCRRKGHMIPIPLAIYVSGSSIKYETPPIKVFITFIKAV